MDHLLERFSKRYLRQGDCWMWQGSLDRDGYGHMRTGNRKAERAHRLAYRLFKGDPGELLVCHTCDNPTCVNPEHLFLGTAKDNWHDMLAKGRGVFLTGENSQAAKLTNEQAARVFELYQTGAHTHKDIAAMFGVSHGLVQRILSGRAWRVLGKAPLGSMRSAPKRGLRKLTDDKIAELIAAYKNGEGSQQKIAERFGVSQAYVSSWLRKHG